MTQTPEPRTEPTSVATEPRPNRLNQTAAWVGIVAGVIFVAGRTRLSLSGVCGGLLPLSGNGASECKVEDPGGQTHAEHHDRTPLKSPHRHQRRRPEHQRGGKSEDLMTQ
jgi:hypothetical protein